MPTATAARTRTLTASEVAWLAAVPVAAAAVLAIALVGPPLGRALLAPGHPRFWTRFQYEVLPEPVEQGRFLVALLAPPALAACTILGVRLRLRATSLAVDALVVAIQAAAIAFAALCLAQQRSELLGPLYSLERMPDIRLGFFTSATLLAAAAGTALILIALASTRMRAALTRWTRDTRARRIAAVTIAVAAIVVWLLHAANTEGSLGEAHRQVRYHLLFTLDETFAVLDGRTPLVDFAAQYGSLWPYAFAGGMTLLGQTVGAWVTLALIATALGMLAIFAVLRRVAGSAIRGLLLFGPVLATSFFMVEGPPENRYTFANYYGTFPLRYAGPSLLAWLLARHLDGGEGGWGRRRWLLFLAAGLVVLNNADVGIPALAATVAALVWVAGRPTRATLGRLALDVGGGLAAAFALVSLLTLLRAGALPDLGLLLRFSRLFGVNGFGLFPMPTFGLHLVLYLTFVAALGLATVRALRAERDRLLTGMLAWSAVFGLGAGAYFAGRSTPDDLVAVFFPWSFALALMLVAVLRELDAGWWRRRPPLATAACVFCFLVMACSLAQTPSPWQQLERLSRDSGSGLALIPGQRFVARHAGPGEPAAILLTLGHYVGARYDVADVSLYSSTHSMPTIEQWEETLARLRAAGGRKLFLDKIQTSPEIQVLLNQEGFEFLDEDEGDHVELWVDTRAPAR
jgi:hypothetical protein